MGLFDFVRNIGRKIFDQDADANDKIKKEIEASLQGVEGLTVDYDAASGVVKLAETAKNPEALEKAVLIAGNAMGVFLTQRTGLSREELLAGLSEQLRVVVDGSTPSGLSADDRRDELRRVRQREQSWAFS